MLRALKLAGFLFGLAAAALDDFAALVQQSRESAHAVAELVRGVADKRDEIDDSAEGWDPNRVCTSSKLEAYSERMTKYKKLTEQEQAKDKAKALVTVGQRMMESQNRANKLLEPMLKAFDASAKYLKAETNPYNVRIVKSILQRVVDPSFVPKDKAIPLNESLKTLQDRFTQELAPHSWLLLKEGFEKLHSNVEAAKSKYPKELRDQLNIDPGYPPEHLADILNLVLPTLSLEANPMLQDVVAMLLKMPHKPEDINKWISTEVLPTMMRKLPQKCQSGRLFTTLGFGKGDMPTRVSKFIDNCMIELGLAAQRHSKMPQLPQRDCMTCQEMYTKLTTTPGDPNSCMAHCMPQTVKCVSTGVDSKCIQSFHGCLRCHAKKLRQLDQCEKTDDRKGLIELITKLDKVVQHANVEKAGVDKFMDEIIDLAKEQP